MAMMSAVDTDPWATVVGQEAVVAQLRAAVAEPVHAYLFLGPEGWGSRVVARAFAAALLAHGRSGEEGERHRHLALEERHPDLVVVDPEGRTVRREEAERLVHEAHRSPLEGDRKVLLGTGFEAPEPAAMALLLKTVEEPPPGRVFLLLADELPPELVTIASRCVRLECSPLPASVVVDQLAAEGVDTGRAAQVAAVAHGDLDRARLLASDERLALRVDAWRAVPFRLDGTGHRVATLVDELRAMISDAAVPLADRQREEAIALGERIERYGQRGSGATELRERHRREQRRARTDELNLGLTELARVYRDHLAAHPDHRPSIDALTAIQATAEGLIRNPNEALALQALLLRLPPLTR